MIFFLFRILVEMLMGEAIARDYEGGGQGENDPEAHWLRRAPSWGPLASGGPAEGPWASEGTSR